MELMSEFPEARAQSGWCLTAKVTNENSGVAWSQDRVDHIARHGVAPEEVEEVCFGSAFLQRAPTLRSESRILCSGTNDGGTILILCCDSISRWHRVSCHCAPDDRQRETEISTMAKTMNIANIPRPTRSRNWRDSGIRMTLRISKTSWKPLMNQSLNVRPRRG